MVLLLAFSMAAWVAVGQDTIIPANIPTLNRVAAEYDFWKWVFGIGITIASGLSIVWTIFGYKTILKTKIDDWLDKNLEKHTGQKIDTIKAAMQEFARNAELKKKRVLVISAASGQQANVKKVLDGCGFYYDDRSWVSINDVPNLVLGNVDVLLLNDQTDAPLAPDQIETVINKFRQNVGYFYLGNEIIDSKKYRKEYGIDIDFANSTTRLESGLLSLLKIR